MLLLFHILNEIERIVGVELLDGRGDHLIGQRFHQRIARILVKLGQRFHIKAAAERGNQLDAVILIEVLNEVGKVRRMQLARRGPNRLLVIIRQGLLNMLEKVGRNRAPLIPYPHIALHVRHLACP